MYPLFETAQIVEGYAGPSEDRVRVAQIGQEIVVIVADGAGGTGNGGAAADLVLAQLEAVATSGENVLTPTTWMKAISGIDYLLRHQLIGQSTVVVAVMTDCSACGVSVGDSGAWLVGTDGYIELTDRQIRKPLVGDGAMPISFERRHDFKTLLVATDGLSKYARLEKICEIVCQADLQKAVSGLVDAVRLPNGKLQDDVGIVICRPGPPIAAHEHSYRHRDEVLKSERCGCFYCIEIFQPSEIRNWIDEYDPGRTAQCLRCGLDSVIGSASGYPITPEFLQAMNNVWFG